VDQIDSFIYACIELSKIPHGLWPKKTTGPKNFTMKKPARPKGPQKFFGPGPTDFLNMKKNINFFKYNIGHIRKIIMKLKTST